MFEFLKKWNKDLFSEDATESSVANLKLISFRLGGMVILSLMIYVIISFVVEIIAIRGVK